MYLAIVCKSSHDIQQLVQEAHIIEAQAIGLAVVRQVSGTGTSEGCEGSVVSMGLMDGSEEEERKCESKSIRTTETGSSRDVQSEKEPYYTGKNRWQ